jgi:GH15 family glucan-1,4-alpha-glucosidase
MTATGLDYGLIGNGRIAALCDRQARIVWWCFPRFDANPVFSRLLAGHAEKGFTDVVLDRQVRSRACYVRNTAILETVLTDEDGAAVRVLDFAPRFRQYGRIFHPADIVRRIEPLSGHPRITIRVRPTFGYGKSAAARTLGSSHIRYEGSGEALRVTTDAPLSYIAEEMPFVATRPMTLVFHPDEPFVGPIEATGRAFETQTADYWRDWVRGLAVPLEWQSEVIRAAITLKLCSFDETGAIIAAHTTSVPESAGSGRTWDYRYCWLRDAYFVVQALNRLGATRTMVSYLDYITNATAGGGRLAPVYGLVPGSSLDEWIAPDLDGYEGHGPVRIGNAAAGQAQHDVYGSVVLAAQQMFLDQRLARMGDVSLYRALERLAEEAWQLALVPDAGIWEYRGSTRLHTHSAAMCWAACHRVGHIAHRLGLSDEASRWLGRAGNLRADILDRCWNRSRNAFTAAPDTDALDASVLLLAELGFVRPDDPRFTGTVSAIERELVRDGHVMRYTAPDDFGDPESAFVICRFWLIDALWAIGRRGDARAHLEELLRHLNPFGLLSEDIDPKSGRLWGNLPQTYSMAGLCVSATRLSRTWEEAWPPG